MRKRWMVIALIFLAILTGTALAEGTIYKDAETGVQFTVPEGWTEQPPEESVSYMAQLEENGVYHQIIFAYVDLWDQASAADKAGYTRSDIDNSILDETDFTAEPGVESVSSVTYNHIEYIKIRLHKTKTIGTISGTVHFTMLVYIQDAVEYMFMYGSTSSVMSRSASFETMLRSVEYPAALVTAQSTVQAPAHTYSSTVPGTYSNSAGELDVATILLSLIVTITVYSLPIIIYRYGIRKRPVTPKKARTITIVWAIIGFIIMSLIVAALGGSGGATGGGIILWSYVNYRMLKSGWEDALDQEESSQFVTLNDAQGQTRYEGYVQYGSYEGKGTLFNAHGEIIYSGLFLGGKMDEPDEARIRRLNDFKATCTVRPMKDIFQNANMCSGMHMCIRGYVISATSGKYPGESVFLMYYDGIRQQDTLISVRYQMGKHESAIPVGDTVSVYGSVDKTIPYSREGDEQTMIPFVSAWCVESE